MSESAATPYVFELLGPQHDRSTFSSGVPALDDYLRRFAGQGARRGLGQTYVAAERASSRVVGYVTLAASSVNVDLLPPARRKGLPRHPVPVALLARLAVDTSWQGQGLGAALLASAVQKAREVAGLIGLHAIVVEAKDESVRRFYLRHGFVALEDDDRHLILAL